MTIVLLLTIIGGNHLSASKLNGIYVAHFAIADNAITFTRDGKFLREARTFGEWEEVSHGTYKLQGAELVLSCYDGRTWIFYYNEEADTLQQQGDIDMGIYYKIN